MKAKSEDESDDRRLVPLHRFHDIGPAIADADYRPRIFGNPEQAMAEAFIKIGFDYGGPLPADFVLHAVLQFDVRAAVRAPAPTLSDY